MANLERIICNVHEPILLRLLVCKEERNTDEPDSCLYPDHVNEKATKKACRDSNKKLAQIYIRHETINPVARSCVLVFIEGKYLSNTNVLIEIFQNTVNWLNIAKEKPYFYVFRYGVPQFDVTTNTASKNLNKKMKEILGGYSRGEDICFMLPVERDAKPLTINCTRIFSFRAS